MRTLNESTWKHSGRFASYIKSVASVLTRLPEQLALVLIVLNLCITVPLAATLNIWFDEAYTLNTSSQNLEYAFQQAIHFEEQAPLYFILITMWRELNSSIFFARLFSITCIGLTIYVTTLLSKLIFKDIHPGWVTATVAFNPFIIWAAVEIRLFALSILLSALLLLFFFRGYLVDSLSSKTERWLYTATAIACLYTHYFLAFLIAACGITLLGLRKISAFWSYCCYMGIVAAGFLPMLILMFSSQQINTWADNPVTAPSFQSSLLENLRVSFGAVLLYLLPAEIGEFSPLSWKLLRLVVLVVLVSLLFVYHRSAKLHHFAIWLVTISTTTIFFAAFEVFSCLGINDSIQHFRHTISLIIPALLSAVAVFSLIQPKQRRKDYLRVWLSFILALNLSSIHLTFSPLAKNGDYDRVAKYLMNNETRNQPILIFNPEVEMALSYYYRGLNPLIPLPRKEEFQTYDLSELTLNSEQEIRTSLAQVPNHQRIWLVIDTGSLQKQLPYQHSYQVLNDFMQKNYVVQQSQVFYGTYVQQLFRVSN